MTDRNQNIDYVKGILVIVMVVYHVINYFAPSAEYGFLRFGTGSFIFLSGYIIATIYRKKYSSDKSKICKRLITRGAKLLVLFSALNLLIVLLGVKNYKGAQFDAGSFLNNLREIYIYGTSEVTAFQILVPIAYLLMISAVYFVCDGSKITPIISTFLLITICLSIDMDAPNLHFGVVGLAGLSVGLLSGFEKFSISKNKYLVWLCLIAVLSIIKYFDRNILTYSIGVLIVLKLFYDLSKTVDMGNVFSHMLILLGQYTLLCYIVQIVFLHMLLSLLKQRWGLGYQTAAIFFGTNIFLLGLCITIKVFRQRYALIDKSYRAIFA